MEKLEKLIYSFKYLPPFLYFGSVGLIGYDIYYYITKETEFLSEYVQIPLTILFFYMTYLGLKNLKKKTEMLKIKMLYEKCYCFFIIFNFVSKLF